MRKARPKPVPRVFEVRIDATRDGSSDARAIWLGRMYDLGAASTYDGFDNGWVRIQYPGNDKEAHQMACSGQAEEDVDKISVQHIHLEHSRFGFWREVIERKFPDADIDAPRKLNLIK
ncbi:hypothetical protein [Rhizobium mongolense]|uniref:hypothetical protein n=1 Tax=Rhizobium mongolense TaxID=57676 RepID=UPI0034A2B1C1